MERATQPSVVALAALTALLLLASPSWAYIGPGAGMVFLSSFLALFAAFIIGIALIFLGVFRWLFGLLRRRRSRAGAQAERVVVIGFDGCDPRIAERLMAEGQLPHLSELARTGTYRPLRTTTPPISPVAWSSFATGANPGKHNIYDFLRRNPQTYEPQLSSTRIRGQVRSLRLGRYRVPLKQPTIEPLQKSKTFWEVLGENGIFAAALRVPITYPPKPFRGVLLSGLCAPDLLGTQGTFAFYTTNADEAREYESGLAFVLEAGRNGRLQGRIRGPENAIVHDGGPLTVPFTLTVNGEAGSARLEIGGQRVELQAGQYSDWVPVVFKPGLWFNVRGICRFCLLSTAPEVRLYQSPINIDPASPSAPVSHPMIFSAYLAKVHGPFATLGLAEDTWALNENILTEQAFLDQCYLFDAEREKLYLDVLRNTRAGLFTAVFDITDRVQHMFLGRSNGEPASPEEIPEPVAQVYRHMDDFIGKLRPKLGERTVLFVMSDHGFGLFSRCFDLNRWLVENGYLALTAEAGEGPATFRQVDWGRTRAYAMGLTGLYLNRKGREKQGIVEAGEAAALKRELIEKLTAVVDPKTGERPIRDVFAATEVYTGPYVREAPDLILGFRRGYRLSWDSVVGKVAAEVFADNPKAWAADHCLHPDEVPGVLFSSHQVDCEDPWIGDLAPTVLGLLGVPPPGYMDGRQLRVRAGGEP
jgi:predicted AlkP superfamily phosphohydrolase/phosphomutase